MPQTLAQIVSEPRLLKHRAVCHDDGTLAELYDMDMKLASAAFKALHMCEIVLRNAIDRELRRWNQAQGYSEAWTLTPAGLLKGCFYNDADELEKARANAGVAIKGKKSAPEHDDVVAQLNFGAWRYLLPPGRTHLAKEKIWDDALHRAFPNLRVSRATLVKSASIAYDFRNRVAHHEPVFHLDLPAKRRNIRDLIDAISPDARKWFAANDELSPRIVEFQQFVKREKLDLRLAAV